MLGTGVIQASWSRCTNEYRLEPQLRRPVDRVSQSNVRDLLGPMEEFLAESSSAVERVRSIARDAECCLLLCDPGGVVVRSYADTAASQALADEGLTIGSRWNEAIVGTNGIGTCIAAGKPITVAGRSHFNQTLKKYTCSAGPIFSPDGRIVGVLDISGRATAGSSEHSFAYHIVREAASAISTALFRKRHQNDCVVVLSRDPQMMPLALNALIATDEAGRVLGATQEALSFLGVAELAKLEDPMLRNLWSVSLDDLKPLSRHSVCFRGANGSDLYVTAFLPEKKNALRPAVGMPAVKPAQRSPTPRKTVVLALDRVAGSDPRMRQSIELSRRVFDNDIPLLLLGETGVGKDSFARAIHAESSRRGKPYQAINCAAIPESLLASELFGYAPGTFTGALKGGRPGRIASSNGGTLLLDEIGDMPLELQAHLLRVLEEREVTPLGAADPVPVDVGIICATHRNLPELVEAGKFRRDLYYRIKGAQIIIPSLRERTDIIDLAFKIIEDESGAEDNGIAVSEDVLELFRRYPWPGNLRELRNTIRWLLSMSDGQKVIVLEHLPEDLLKWAPASSLIAEHPQATLAAGASTLEHAYEQIERGRIAEALRARKWCITSAAQDLGISRATLHRKVRKYDLVSPNQQT